ncbi:uncharacterized protein LTR77_005319 [Saxophila tyrrhenica]|uniref:Uncharacterized protein n=1 Tax=Saxophila tyrrhenica TaxID=1690608 RepID=A0AAV9PBL7_9PEZI|nr:hypothetical protein LTR77_005319 [Saxophila tyrrhenica]
MGNLLHGLAFAFLVASSACRDIPSNVQSFVDRVKSGKCEGGSILQDGFYANYAGGKTQAYCQDDATGAIYIVGDSGSLADMDVDCDGAQSDHGDGRCGYSDDT